MGRYIYLIKNIGLLALSNFATKILSFFLVPLYTAILSTTDYGIYDLFNTTVGVLLPILTLNIQEGVLRYALEKDIDKRAIVTVGFRYLFLGSIIVIVGVSLLNIIGISTILQSYGIYFFLMFFAQALSGLVIFYTRGIGKISDLSVTSVITSAVTISLNILFLVFFHWGLVGYFLANIIGPLVQCLYLIIKERMVPDIKLFHSYPMETKLLVLYSLPLIANSLAWWVNNSSDRYIIIFFCGMAANGIYSVASKIPSILAVFQSIFSQAWTLSAVQDFDPEDSNGFFAHTYTGYNCLMTLICSGIIVCDKLLASFLYAKDFFAAWQYVPWLTIAILFGAMSGYIGGIFVAVKNSKIFASSTLIGAILNVVFNILLVPEMGVLGAAIATAICYIVVWGIRLKQSRKYMRLRINIKRDIVAYLLLIFQSVALLLIADSIKLYAVLIGIFFVILLLYSHDVQLAVKKVMHK